MRLAVHPVSSAYPSTGVMLGAVVLIGTLGACDKEGDEPAPAVSTTPVAGPAAVSATPALEKPAQGAAASASASEAPAAANLDYDSIVECCRALQSAAAKADGAQSKYTTAAAVCSGIARQVKKGGADPGSARTLIRAQLQGVTLPAGC